MPYDEATVSKSNTTKSKTKTTTKSQKNSATVVVPAHDETVQENGYTVCKKCYK